MPIHGKIVGEIERFFQSQSQRPPDQVFRPIDDRPAKLKFSSALMAKARIHVAHGHKRSSGGHDFLITQLADAARRSIASVTPCQSPLVRDADGACRFPGSPADRDINGQMESPVGEAVMGRYGAALVPGNRAIQRAVCLPGMQLGDDGFCYNKGSISNRQRMWPKGRAPLLTGGQMRAISIAATAGRRLERTTKRLQKIGLMKKPASRRKITSGAHTHA